MSQALTTKVDAKVVHSGVAVVIIAIVALCGCENQLSQGQTLAPS